MDPLAHTLVGATLAETGLKRASRMGALSLMVGANLPDVDALAMLWGQDTALLVRRGWTHGALGIVVLPLVWVGVLVAFDHLARRWRGGRAPPLRLGYLLALTYGAALTHPFLDWLNTYGVRLLMPFDARWFYGDALFIIDPWIWLLMASAVVLAHARGTIGITGWAILAVGATALIVGVDRVPILAKALWLVGVAAIVVLRLRGPSRSSPRLARVTLGVAALYIAATLVGNRVAEHQAASWLRAQGLEASVVLVGPLPARPLARDVVAQTADHYHFVELAWWGANRFSHPPLPTGDADDPVVRAALTTPDVRGLRAWLRLPAYEVERTAEGWRVTIRDVRYARPETERRTTIGRAVIELDADLAPLVSTP